MRDRVVDTTVRLEFNTNDADGAPVAPSSAFAASDFVIYKDGSATQKTTTDGVTVTSPFDSLVGLHLIEIDTSNDTNAAGFWVAGSEYRVAISSAKTVDGVSQSGVIVGLFRLVTGTVELDSASRLAIWNELTTQSFTADSFGELLIISDGTNGREVKVTGANHIAADVHDVQPDGLTNSTKITNIENASGYLLAVLAGACADPQTASETYAITVFGSTFTVDMAGQTSTGTRTAPTLTKT